MIFCLFMSQVVSVLILYFVCSCPKLFLFRYYILFVHVPSCFCSDIIFCLFMSFLILLTPAFVCNFFTLFSCRLSSPTSRIVVVVTILNVPWVLCCFLCDDVINLFVKVYTSSSLEEDMWRELVADCCAGSGNDSILQHVKIRNRKHNFMPLLDYLFENFRNAPSVIE